MAPEDAAEERPVDAGAAPADTRSAATGDRAATERLIEAAAIDLLRENGVLAGLNLREVADRAEVNRGLVYHYYGNRRELLRSALRHQSENAPTWGFGNDNAEKALVERAVDDLDKVIQERSQVEIFTLLHLDRDPDIRVMPTKRLALALLLQDQKDGDIADGVDLEALHALLVSLAAGYALFRERFAAELDRPADEIDQALSAMLARCLTGLRR
jgi:AcrR family transcriptional regulator